MKRIYDEAIRIVKPKNEQGKIIILEHLTPNYTLDQFKDIIEKTSNLKIIETIIPENTQRWNEIVERYNPLAKKDNSQTFPFGAYIIICEKLEPN